MRATASRFVGPSAGFDGVVDGPYRAWFPTRFPTGWTDRTFGPRAPL